MATHEEVEATIAMLVERLHGLDSSSRSGLPAQRTIETICPDLDSRWHAVFSEGTVSEVQRGSPPKRADIRVKVNSDDLLALAHGSLPFRQAWQAGRVKIDASMTDMLRLRAAL